MCLSKLQISKNFHQHSAIATLIVHAYTLHNVLNFSILFAFAYALAVDTSGTISQSKGTNLDAGTNVHRTIDTLGLQTRSTVLSFIATLTRMPCPSQEKSYYASTWTYNSNSRVGIQGSVMTKPGMLSPRKYVTGKHATYPLEKPIYIQESEDKSLLISHDNGRRGNPSCTFTIAMIAHSSLSHCSSQGLVSLCPSS